MVRNALASDVEVLDLELAWQRDSLGLGTRREAEDRDRRRKQGRDCVPDEARPRRGDGHRSHGRSPVRRRGHSRFTEVVRILPGRSVTLSVPKSEETSSPRSRRDTNQIERGGDTKGYTEDRDGMGAG